MSFFYDLNKKLDGIRATPETTHKQLNERDMGKHNNATTGFAALAKKAGKEYGSKAAGERVAGAVKAKMAKAGKLEEQNMEEGLGDMARKVGSMAKKVGGKVLDKLGHGSDEDMIRDLQRKAGVPQTGKKPEQAKEGVDKQAFAALAPPKDKITFADKIAGAKKEVDEMLGDVAAEAIKSALTPKQKKLDKNQNGSLDANDFAMLRKGAKKPQVADEGWDDMIKDVHSRAGQMKPGEKIQGHKGEIEKTSTGIRHTRRYDDKTGVTDTGDDTPAAGEKRGRGRPKSTGGPRQERATAKSRKSDRTSHGQAGFKKAKVADESVGDNSQLKAAMAMLKKAGYTVSKKSGEEELDEKAVSKKQQRFMGMVHATQKGEKAPSKEVAKVAKEMPQKAAKDFASTKQKGLPEKAPKKDTKSEAPKKKKEKTEEQGGTGTPTASSGFSFGQGIYDSMNHDLENMIKESMQQLEESMSVNMSMNNDQNGGPGTSLTVTATEDDALKLGKLLKMAGLGNGDDVAGDIRAAELDHAEGGEECPTCGSSDCGCEQEMDEAYGDNQVSQNEPNWPTNQETAQDNFEYSGGLNKPKSTGQTTTPVLSSQEERQITREDEDLARMKEIAGIKEAKKVEEDDVEEGNKFTGNLAKARADGKKTADLDGDGDMEKVKESIFSLTNQWKAYKG